MSELEPTITCYRGKRLDTMTREELIEVIVDQDRWCRTVCKGAQDDRAMMGRVFKEMRS